MDGTFGLSPQSGGYHSCTLGAHVSATVVGPSPSGLQFCYLRYICRGGVTQVDHESAQLSRFEAVTVASLKFPESPDNVFMNVLYFTRDIYVGKSGSLRIWRPQRSWCLPPRQEQSQPPNRLVGLCNRVLNQVPNQPHAQLPPPHQPAPHTLCLLCKLNMCNSSKCAILVPRSSLPFLWTPNNICYMNHVGRASTQKSLHLCSVCLQWWGVPQFALKYPCNPGAREDRHLATASLPQGETVARYRGRFRGGGGQGKP